MVGTVDWALESRMLSSTEVDNVYRWALQSREMSRRRLKLTYAVQKRGIRGGCNIGQAHSNSVPIAYTPHALLQRWYNSNIDSGPGPVPADLQKYTHFYGLCNSQHTSDTPTVRFLSRSGAKHVWEDAWPQKWMKNCSFFLVVLLIVIHKPQSGIPGV
jgi:hypothetical protein